MSFPLPEMHPCYFCEIIQGKAGQWNIIEHNDQTVTMLNGRQFEVGQCLVLPVRHAATLLDLTEEEGSAVLTAARRITRAMVKEYAPDGVLVYQNNGLGSGQEVPHFHLHVVPRRQESDWGFGPPHIARLEQEQRPAHIDHEGVTEAKCETVHCLRKHFQ